MQKSPLIAVVVALLLLVGLYFGVNTKPPKPKEEAGQGAMAAGATAAKTSNFDVDSLIVATKKKMAQHALGELQAVEINLSKLQDSAKMPQLFEQYADIWKEHKQYPIAAYYYYSAAKLVNSEKKLTFAAQLFLDLARNEHSGELQTWEAQAAKAAFEQVLELNPNNDTAKLDLAECYFGTGEAMKGVVLVKEITAKEPEHAAANMLLGQQGLISGQYAKAQQRFETVLKKEPENLEAMIGLAEAFKGLGEKEKAIALLQKCKTLIKNPAFAKDIDAYIKSFK